MNKEVKLLIFDLDNTLINYGGVTQKAWELTCEKLLEKHPSTFEVKALVTEIIRVNDEIWENEDKRPKGDFSFYDLRKRIVKEAFDNMGIVDGDIEFLVSHYDYYKHEAVYVFADVHKTLLTLRGRGYTLALLTNGNALVQREKLERFKLEPLLDYIFIEGEQGVGKPDYEAYENVLKKCQVQPVQACMIGDHFLWEVVAPKQYGLNAIWVNRGNLGLKGNEKIKPDYTIKNIEELLAIFL